MAIMYDGMKLLKEDSQGTDLHLLDNFIRKNKLKGGVFLYYDDKGELMIEGLYRKSEGREQCQEIFEKLSVFFDEINR